MSTRIFYAACGALGATVALASIRYSWDGNVKDWVRAWSVELEDRLQRNLP